MTATDGSDAKSLTERSDLHAQRTIALNMKLQDASLSAIEAAQVLADSCFCQSQEAVVLDRILSVIDELDDVIRALHAPRRPSIPRASPMIERLEGDISAFRKVFVPVGRGAIFRETTPPTGADHESGGTALKAEDADQFLAALIGGSEDEAPSLTTVCRSASKLLRMSGAAVVLMGDGTFPSVASAYGVSVAVQDLELTLGEGPAIDAYAEGKPVLVDHVGSFSSRWPQFGRAAAEAGIQSVYALPLQLGAIKLGVLVLYREQPGILEGEDLSAALLVANLVCNQVIDMQAGAVSESLAWGLEVDDYRAVVHQATGMISVQLDCAIGEALVRLRGQAFASDRPLDEVAAEVVTGETRFEG
ncbi:MAG TPA: GAF and ANTAR domain-containing protein [Acidimicrobiales bacterium]|nr:GAF and ANTAR domain-containing protein [Acidimicrobiales bacterium]